MGVSHPDASNVVGSSSSNTVSSQTCSFQTVGVRHPDASNVVGSSSSNTVSSLVHSKQWVSDIQMLLMWLVVLLPIL